VRDDSLFSSMLAIQALPPISKPLHPDNTAATAITAIILFIVSPFYFTSQFHTLNQRCLHAAPDPSETANKNHLPKRQRITSMKLFKSSSPTNRVRKVP
jgi:hypothetical protein